MLRDVPESPKHISERKFELLEISDTNNLVHDVKNKIILKRRKLILNEDKTWNNWY